MNKLTFQGTQWKEALKILKLVVTRSSTLVAPPTSMHGSSWDSSLSSPHPSFTDTEIFTKKELPGKSTSSLKLINAYLLFPLDVYYRFCFSSFFATRHACMARTIYARYPGCDKNNNNDNLK